MIDSGLTVDIEQVAEFKYTINLILGTHKGPVAMGCEVDLSPCRITKERPLWEATIDTIQERFEKFILENEIKTKIPSREDIKSILGSRLKYLGGISENI